MHNSVLYLCAAVVLLLTIKVRSDDMPNVYEFCSQYLSEEESESETSDNNKSEESSSFEKKIATLEKKILIQDEKIASQNERIEHLEKIVAPNSPSKSAEKKDSAGMSAEKNESAGQNTVPECKPSPDGKFTSSASFTKGPCSKLFQVWCADVSDEKQWLQVDFGSSKKLMGVATENPLQGIPTRDSLTTYLNTWKRGSVETYKLSCGNSIGELKTIKDAEGKDMIFKGGFAMVKIWLPVPMYCRYVRLHPKSWNRVITIRMHTMTDCRKPEQ